MEPSKLNGLIPNVCAGIHDPPHAPLGVAYRKPERKNETSPRSLVGLGTKIGFHARRRIVLGLGQSIG